MSLKEQELQAELERLEIILQKTIDTLAGLVHLVKELENRVHRLEMTASHTMRLGK